MWDLIREEVEAEGLMLFDIDLPASSGNNGVFRVYIIRRPDASKVPTEPKEVTSESSSADTRPDRESGISLEQCVRVSKRILDVDEKQQIIPDGCSLEVSSPGINRRLRRPEHFSGAQGERVKVKFASGERSGGEFKSQVVVGTLQEVSDGALVVAGEEPKEIVRVPMDKIREARVEFRFA